VDDQLIAAAIVDSDVVADCHGGSAFGGTGPTIDR
jgi:hypothetical protein